MYSGHTPLAGEQNATMQRETVRRRRASLRRVNNRASVSLSARLVAASTYWLTLVLIGDGQEGLREVAVEAKTELDSLIEGGEVFQG